MTNPHFQRFEGKTVIVTGSSSGMGLATARRFAAEGANVVLNSRSRDDLEQVATDFDKARVLIVPGDVSARDFAPSLVKQTIEAFGRLDVLVSNAGVATFGMLTDSEEDDIDTVIDVNVKGTLRVMKAAIPELAKTEGSIVCTSSVSGTGGDWLLPIYCASKGAVTNLVRAMALQLGEQRIRVNAVCPSLTRTEMADGVIGNEPLKEQFMQRIPLGRAGEPEDVADVIAFLASDDARFVNGVNLAVDGGLSASNGQPNMAAYQ